MSNPNPSEHETAVNEAETRHGNTPGGSEQAGDVTSHERCSSCGSTGACTCKDPQDGAQLVYALGRLTYDFANRGNLDSFRQHMRDGTDPTNPVQLLAYLEENPWESSDVLWVLDLDGEPIYAIQPGGAFAADTYARLRRFLKEQLTEGVERISIPGVIVGQTTLMMGEVVPTLLPHLRGMYSWTTKALVKRLSEADGRERGTGKKSAGSQHATAIQNFLERVYFEFRSLGQQAQDRALNYAATNAFAISKVFESAAADEMELDTVSVERSPIFVPKTNCWDVKLVFFDPAKQLERARKVYRLTVDVRGIEPVIRDQIRSWSAR